MALEKTTKTFTFGRGVSLKDAEYLIPIGKFFALNNCVFDTLAQLRKRNGFGPLTSTIGSVSYVTTFENNLIGLGSNIQAYSRSLNQFINKGSFPQIQFSTTPVANALYGYTQTDLAISNNGLMCVTSAQIGSAPNVSSGIPVVYSYTITDQATGQIVSGPTTIVGSGGSQTFPAKVFAVGSQFVVVFDVKKPVSVGSSAWIEYIKIPTGSPTNPSSPITVSSNFFLSGLGGFDGAVTSTSGLYLSWIGDSQITNFSSLINPVTQSQSAITSFGISNVTGLGVAPDYTKAPSTMWNALIRNASGSYQYVARNPDGTAVSNSSIVVCSGTYVIGISSSSFNIRNIAMTAQNGSMTAFIELNNSYGYDDSVKTNILCTQTMGITGSGSVAVSSAVQMVRGLGLASKGFIFNSTSYVMGLYTTSQGTNNYQSTYFMVNSSGQVQSKIAYGNATQSYIQNLPSISVVGSSAYFPYLIQNTISPVGKLTNTSSQTGIYGKLGINIGQLNFSTTPSPPIEIGNNLLLGGGFLGAYDGFQFTENDFYVYPDAIEAQTASTGGSMASQAYSYALTYEWSDNKGNIFRSAPSIPITVTTNGSGGQSISSCVIKAPTLRTSYKNWPYGGINSPVKIVVYRYSTAQPLYLFNQQFVQDTTVLNTDFVTFTDTFPDNQISGNQVLYTNGGVVEDFNGPSVKNMTTFDSRLWMISGDDQNLLLFSKQVIENTPVEMSAFFTFYVAPNVGAEGPTGVMNCLAPMDDKLIIFKESAIYYINGVGPDNTGAQNQYSQPIFVTSGVGCSNQNSIVLIPNGLMFQSNKGIWLLGRDLSTSYIGKDVESLANTNVVQSAITVPGTNQIRFTMNTGITLLYDYFVNEWGTFSGQPGISSCLYNNLHTYVNSSSSVFQETPGVYQDGTTPVLMSFTTGWIGLAGLQGYKRAYNAFLLGTYYSPHNFTMGIGYDYNSSILQTVVVNPTNTVGSGSQVEQWQMNFIRQQCQSFQLTFNEVSSQSAGQGLTISGLDLVYGVKHGYPSNLSQRNSVS